MPKKNGGLDLAQERRNEKNISTCYIVLWGCGIIT